MNTILDPYLHILYKPKLWPDPKVARLLSLPEIHLVKYILLFASLRFAMLQSGRVIQKVALTGASLGISKGLRGPKAIGLAPKKYFTFKIIMINEKVLGLQPNKLKLLCGGLLDHNSIIFQSKN